MVRLNHVRRLQGRKVRIGNHENLGCRRDPTWPGKPGRPALTSQDADPAQASWDWCWLPSGVSWELVSFRPRTAWKMGITSSSQMTTILWLSFRHGASGALGCPLRCEWLVECEPSQRLVYFARPPGHSSRRVSRWRPSRHHQNRSKIFGGFETEHFLQMVD